jgi:pyruvate/2-oxoglutarate dehydrogenase complex dihydrolipoamide dehydrogenase (E3) component
MAMSQTPVERPSAQAAHSSVAPSQKSAFSHSPEVLPQDEYNATLIANVHPADWQNPQPASRYNLVVIGAGTAGLVTAAGAAGLGAKVALVERHLMGGDCLNVGCVPSKCVIRSSRVVGDLAAAAELGVRVPAGTEVDFPAVMERMRRLRARISQHDSARRFHDQLGVDVFLGEGRFVGPHAIEVGGNTLHYKRAVIATGARAVHPPIPGLAEVGFLTNETVFSLTEQPRRLAVIGGGPLGCELAQAFHRLGSEVTIVEMERQFLLREDPEAAAILLAVFQREGLRVKLNTTLKKVTSSGQDKYLHLDRGGNEEILAVDAILVGVGRAPNVEGLNLEAAGVIYDRKKGVRVNDRLQTTTPHIYAAGDICSDYKFTHAADAAARVVIQNALFYGRKKLSTLTIPWCTYTDPEIAHVGIYEQEAEKQGIGVSTFTIPLREVDRALADGEEEGFVKIHVKKGTDQILGATIVARHAGEMLNEITLAMTAKIGLGTLSAVIHPYPTQAEAIRKAADAYNRTRLTPLVKKLFNSWLAWTR